MSTSSSTSSESPKPLSPDDRLRRAFRRGSAPPPRLSWPDWADRYRKLAREAGSTSGAWRTSTVEIARGPMLAATEPGVHVITAMVATQLLKTSLLENGVGYFAHLDPCPMLLVQPKEAAAEQFSKERITPLIKATPALRALIGTAKTRKSDETLLFKAFPGGFLALAGAGSPDNLARRPVRVVFYDEVDKYPVTREGDPIALGDERMATFVSWLSVRVCSPTVAGESRIEASYEEGDRRRASLECPHCRHRQFPEWRHVEWTKEEGRHLTADAQLFCELCRKPWSNAERLRALATIRWHQTRPFTCCGQLQMPLDAYATAWREHGLLEAENEVWDWWAGPRYAVYRAKCCECGAWAVPNEHASFQAGKLFSPWPKDAPARQAQKFIAAQGDEDRLQAWWNTQQGLPYKRNAGRAVSPEGLASRVEVWGAEVPDGVAIITVGLDTQDYRVEAYAYGWGRNEECWRLEKEVFEGDPENDPQLWRRIDDWLKKVRFRADGRPFEVAAACFDSGGHHTQKVYEFCKARLGRKIWAIKGESANRGVRNPVWPVKRPTSRSKKSFSPILLGVNAAKDALQGRLGRDRPGPGYIHFPADTDLAEFAQLTAERRISKVAPGGHKYGVWELIPGRANEGLDCWVYAFAALHGLIHMGLKLNRKADAVGAAMTPVAGDVDDEPPPERPTPSKSAAKPVSVGADTPPPPPPPPTPPPPRRVGPGAPDQPQRRRRASRLA